MDPVKDFKLPRYYSSLDLSPICDQTKTPGFDTLLSFEIRLDVDVCEKLDFLGFDRKIWYSHTDEKAVKLFESFLISCGLSLNLKKIGQINKKIYDAKWTKNYIDKLYDAYNEKVERRIQNS